jgi:hypothetical protein
MADPVSYEKFFPAIPLVGTSIAICFDVGYFYGVGIDYFTLFSLTEHIGFALEALPFALAISLFALLIDAVTEVRRGRLESWRAALPVSAIERIAFLRRRMVKLTIRLVLLAVGTLAYFWYLGAFRIVVLTVVIIAATVVDLLAKERWYSSSVISLVLIGSTTALLFGEFVGSNQVANPTAIDSIGLQSGDTISVNVIRSGERGVLYVKLEPPIVEFIQWGAIKSISRHPKRSMFP